MIPNIVGLMLVVTMTFSNYRFKPTLLENGGYTQKGYLTYGSDAPANTGFMRFWDGTNTHGNAYIRDTSDGTYGTLKSVEFLP